MSQLSKITITGDKYTVVGGRSITISPSNENTLTRLNIYDISKYEFLTTLTRERLRQIIRDHRGAVETIASYRLHTLIFNDARNKLKELDYFLNECHNFSIYCDTESSVKFYGHTFDIEKYDSVFVNDIIGYTDRGILIGDKSEMIILPDYLWLMLIINQSLSPCYHSQKTICDIYRYFIAKIMEQLIRYFNLSLTNLIVDYLE